MVKPSNNRKIAIYSRKSKFTGKGESIENQVEMCRQYIKFHRPDSTEADIIVFEDEGFSGGHTKRPEFQKMMTEIKANHIQEVVCYRLDRISRNVGDFADLIQELENYNVAFASYRDSFDTSSAGGRAMMMMISVFSQFERETIAERIRDNMHELAKSGRWLGGVTPTGYMSTQIDNSITHDGKVRTAFKLGIIKEEAKLVKDIFTKFAELNSLTKVETYLRQNHIQTKNGTNFSRFAIKGILSNPVYMIADENAWQYFEKNEVNIYAEKSQFNGKYGVMAYNKTSQVYGKSNELNEMTEWIISVGKHTGMVSGAEWVKVQQLLHQNKSKSFHKPKSNVALLSGLIYCGNCGSYMRPKMNSRFNKKNERMYDYLCETKEKTKSQDCKMKRPNGNILDQMVCEHIKQLSEDSSEFVQLLEKAKKTINGNNDGNENKLESLQKEFEENEKQISNLISQLAKSEKTVTFEYINQKIEELHDKKISLQKNIDEWRKVTENHVLSDSDFDILKDMLLSFSHSFDTMTVEQKRTALRTFIKKVVWDGENVHIYLFGSDKETTGIHNGIPVADSQLKASENHEPKREDSK